MTKIRFSMMQKKESKRIHLFCNNYLEDRLIQKINSETELPLKKTIKHQQEKVLIYTHFTSKVMLSTLLSVFAT